jgi:hypothetical protein
MSALTYKAGQSVETGWIDPDVYTALQGDSTIPTNVFVVLCDDREFGENYPSINIAGFVAKRWSEAWPNHAYHVVKVRRASPREKP